MQRVQASIAAAITVAELEDEQWKPSDRNHYSPSLGDAARLTGSGHDGERGADGRFVAKDKERKRWTTALRIEALDQLNALAVRAQNAPL